MHQRPGKRICKAHMGKYCIILYSVFGSKCNKHQANKYVKQTWVDIA